MEPIGCPETSGTNHKSRLCKFHEERRFLTHANRLDSEKFRLVFQFSYTSVFKMCPYTRVGTLIVATIYLQLNQNRYMFRSISVLHCSHQHCVQPVTSDVEVVGNL